MISESVFLASDECKSKVPLLAGGSEKEQVNPRYPRLKKILWWKFYAGNCPKSGVFVISK
jgi:hypothetical protein